MFLTSLASPGPISIVGPKRPPAETDAISLELFNSFARNSQRLLGDNLIQVR